MEKKKLLLITSKMVGDTGKISFKYLFSIKGVYDKYEEARSELWGYAHKDKDRADVVPFNIFHSSRGLHMAGAFGQGEADESTFEHFPESCSLLCTTETADILEKIIGERIQITRVFSEQTLLTA